jgi:hypothetical protein
MRAKIFVFAVIIIMLAAFTWANQTESEPNENMGSADGPINFNETLTGGLPAGYGGETSFPPQDYWTFSATAGYSYTFYAVAQNCSSLLPSLALDLALDIENSSGSIIAFTDIGWDCDSETLNWTCSASGTYYMIVWEATGNTSATAYYTVSCTETAPPGPPFDSFVRCTPLYEGMYVEWDETTDVDTPIEYNIYLATTSGGQNFGSPDYTTADLHYEITGLTNGTPYYVVVRYENNSAELSSNTDEKMCVPGTNMMGGTAYNNGFEVDSAGSGKPTGWADSEQGNGTKTTDYSIVGSGAYEGSNYAYMETTGTPVDPLDLSIASLTCDTPITLQKDHTYAVSAAVGRSESQWCRFILYSFGFTIIHTESFDALDSGSGDSGWERLYFYYRAPLNQDVYLRIDSIVTNARTSGGGCGLALDDVQIVDMGVETYTDNYDGLAVPKIGIRNSTFDLGTVSSTITIGGTIYTTAAMPKQWGMAMAVDVGSNDDTSYPIWGEETPGSLSDVTGNAGFVTAKAADTTAASWPAITANGGIAWIELTEDKGQRHVLSFNYGTDSTTKPLLRVFCINNDFDHTASLYIDPVIGIPGNRMWSLTLHHTPAYSDDHIKVRFDNVTIGASGSGLHADETKFYIDNVILGIVD